MAVDALPAIGNTGLRRVYGGENCEAIAVPPDPSPTASREARMAGYQARGDALAKRAACYQANADQLDAVIKQLDALANIKK
jgi:hypothetical protein